MSPGKGIISFQGALGAYSHQACLEARPSYEPKPVATFEGAIDLVRRGEAQLAMIPVENSTYGRVADVHQLLPESGLHIIGEHFVRVHINLLGLPGAQLDQITRAQSHSVLLGQCRSFLQAHDIARITGFDTAGAAEHVRDTGDPTLGALASPLAGEIYGLDVLGEHIEDTKTNSAGGRDAHDHLVPVPGAQPASRALQGDGRICDQWCEHGQAGELYGRRLFHRDAVLCRYRRPPR